MQIELKEKIIKTKGKEFSYCLVLYSADGNSMHQYAVLNNELPNEILLQMCKTWAERHLTQRAGDTATPSDNATVLHK